MNKSDAQLPNATSQRRASSPRLPLGARDVESMHGFVIGSAAAILVVLAVQTETPALHVAILGLISSLVVGFVVTIRGQQARQQRGLDTLADHSKLASALVSDNSLFHAYRIIHTALVELARYPNCILREMATTRVEAIANEMAKLARGHVTFEATETWRSAYETVLRLSIAKMYYSVAWVRSADYWNDPPGRHGMRLNFQLLQQGYRIERIVILPDLLWPFDEPFPTHEISTWLNDQHQHGIHLSLVREHELADEPDLLCDLGIYGTQAVGYHEVDERSKTARFHLDFDSQSHQAAMDHWQRLSLFATPFARLLDERRRF